MERQSYKHYQMHSYRITIHITGLKKLLRGIRAFPDNFNIHDVREYMACLLLYYYCRKDIRQIDAVPIEESHNMHHEKDNCLAAVESSDKKNRRMYVRDMERLRLSFE